MEIVTIHEAKTHLSKLIQRALDGEEIIIAKRDEPLVKLTVIKDQPASRRFGGLKDLVLKMGDSFDDPMDEFGERYFPSARVAEDPLPYNKK